MSITANYRKIRNEIPDHVTIVLAAKTRTPEEVEEVIVAGATDIGHNYVQEAEAMYKAFGENVGRVRWHMIGNVQKNKINKALPIFDVFQTIDSLEKAQAIEKRATRFGKVLSALIEVNIGAESSKSGMSPEYEQIEQLVRDMSTFESLRIEGLMTMGPLSSDPEESRPYYREAKKIFDKIASLNLSKVQMKILSMGMSDSYKVAIEEGSNMVRLGTVVFGPRQYT